MAMKLEEIKRRFNVLENGIKADYSDASQSLRDFVTWYPYFLTTVLPGDYLTVFFNEALPNFLKYVLKRKYASNQEHILEAQIFIDKTIKFLTGVINLGFDGVAEAVKEILDPKQPFYAKYGFPEVEAPAIPTPSEPSIPYDEAFLLSLQVGDCADYKGDDGNWECVSIESISPYKTELEIKHITYDDRVEWISVQKNGHRFAPAFTKTGGMMDETPGASTAAVGPSTSVSVIEIMDVDEPNVQSSEIAAGIPDSNAIVTTISIDDIAWKFQLTVGDLVDAKDPSGIWYQACIMEIKSDQACDVMQESQSVNFYESKTPVTDNFDDHNAYPSTTQKLKRARKGDDAYLNATQIEVQIDRDDMNDMEGNGLDKMQESPMDIDDKSSSDINFESSSAEPNDIISLSKSVKLDLQSTSIELSKKFRISYLGLPEKNDEWIELKNDRIQRLNSNSHRRRGDNPLREEVLFVMNRILSPLEDVQHAVLRDSCFLSPYYVNVVNTFALQNGFDSILNYLTGNDIIMTDPEFNLEMTIGNLAYHVNRSQDSEYKPSLYQTLQYSLAIGGTHSVLSLSFLSAFADRFASFAIKRILSMTLPEIRQTGFETLEPVLEALEELIFARYGRNIDGGRCFEEAWFDLAVKYITSPYLNRRLGGLRLLTVLTKRGNYALNHSDGLKITTTVTSSEVLSNDSKSDGTLLCKPINDAFIGPKLPGQSSGTDSKSVVESTSISYQVMPVLYHLTLSDICNRLLQLSVLESIFVGELAHGSLIERLADVLKAISITGHLSKEIVQMIWETAYDRKEPAAWKILIDFAGYSSLSSLSWLLEYIKSIPNEFITVEIVNILFVLSSRTRDILFGNISLHDSVNRVPSMENFDILSMNITTLDTIWNWCVDQSGVSDNVVEYAINQLEGAISLGISAASVFDRTDFPWDKHWLRACKLIDRATIAIQRGESLIPAMKVVQLYINSWTISPHSNIGVASSSFYSFPFENASRIAVAKYLEVHYHILSNMSNAIQALKATVDRFVERDYPHLLKENSSQLSKDTQNILCEILVPNCRITYRLYLNKALDFLYFFARNCEGIEVPLGIIENIWTSIVRKARTSAEVEAVVAFMRKLTLPVIPLRKRGKNGALPTVTMTESDDLESLINESTDEIPSSDKTPIAISPKSLAAKSYVCSTSTLSSIFVNLFCDRDYFITSSFYNEGAFGCTEKLFILLNSFENLILECKVAKGGSTGVGNAPFIIIGPPSKLVYWEIFFDIALFTPNENVAIKAVKFITSFPQKLSSHLVESGEVSVVRKTLLTHAMSMLEKLKVQQSLSRQNSSSITEEKSDPGIHANTMLTSKLSQIKRCLILLDEILEEAAYDSRNKFRSHGYLTQGAMITFKISTQGKLSKYNGETFQASLNESVEDILTKITKIIQRPSTEIRALHRAKDLVVMSDRKKLLNQLGTLSETESIMIVDKGNQNAKTLSTAPSEDKSTNDSNKLVRFSDTNQSSASQTGSIQESFNSDEILDKTLASITANDAKKTIKREDLPAVMISENPAYLNLLFELIDVCEDSLCDDIWSLLNRLPSSPLAVQQLMEIQSNNVSELIFQLSSKPSLHHSPAGLDKDTRESSISLSRFLYILNIVEYLLQPSDKECSITLIQHLFVDISLDDLMHWPKKFLSCGGFLAIFDILQHVTLFCPVGDLSGIYDSESQMNMLTDTMKLSSSGLGYSSSMLMSLLRLVSRLTRSFIVRSSSSLLHSKGKLHLLLTAKDAFSIDKKAKVEEKPIVNSVTAIEVIENDNMDSHGVGTSERMVEDDGNMIDDSHKQIQQAIKKELVSEWGWTLTFSEDDSSTNSYHEYFSPERYGALFQKYIIQLTSFMRYLSKNNELFGARKYSTSNEKLIVEGRHDKMMEILSDLTTSWSAVIMLYPQILYSFQHSDRNQSSVIMKDLRNTIPSTDTTIEARFILKQIVAGEFSEDIMNRVEKHYNHSLLKLGYYNSLENNIGMLFGNVLEWILNYLDDADIRNEFYRVLLLSLIDIRPHVSIQISTDDDRVIDASKKYQPLFRVMKALLLQSHSMNSSFINEERRLFITMEIVNELKSAFELLNSPISHVVASKSTTRTNQTARSIYHVEGTMDLLATLSKGYKVVLQTLYDNSFLVFLLQNCLGLYLPSSRDFNSGILPLCSNDDARESVYSLIEAFGEWNQDLIVETLLYLKPIHQAVPTPSMWGYDAQNDALSTTGFVGLRNMGCTCYMNGLIQVLFMLPQFRKRIISAKIPPALYENFGELKNHYVAQLQKMFLYLQFSRKKAFSPDDWVYCYKDESGLNPINVLHQQDAQEFLQVLFDRLESSYEHIEKYHTSSLSMNGQSIDNPDKNVAQSVLNNKNFFVSELIGGVMCDQMLKESSNLDTSNSTDISKDIRERTDSFICMSVDVKGSKNLQDSLCKFIQGERIADYLWDETNGTRTTIIKRQCISDLSDTLIFHLKRFELNFDTFTREKVNDIFSFPQELDMYPYSRESLMNDSNQSSKEDSNNMYDGVSNNNTMDQSKSNRRDNGYYKFSLKGIVVHTGTADSGHYFSYIKNPNNCDVLSESFSANDTSQDSWFEFNDSNVKAFSPDDIPSQCYGGNFTTYEQTLGTNTLVEVSSANPQSAYMLVYQRIKCITPENNHHPKQQISSQSSDQMVESMPQESESLPRNVEDHRMGITHESRLIDDSTYSFLIQDEIKRGNLEHLLSLRILSSKHLGFLISLLKQLLAMGQRYIFSTAEIASTVHSHGLVKTNISHGSELCHRYYQSLLYDMTILGLRLVTRTSQQAIITSYLHHTVDLHYQISDHVFPVHHAATSIPKNASNSNLLSGNLIGHLFSGLHTHKTENVETKEEIVDNTAIYSHVSLKEHINWSEELIIRTASKATLEKMVSDMDTFIISGLFCVSQDHRQLISNIIFLLFKKVFTLEGPNHESWFARLDLLRQNTISSAYREALGGGNMYDNNVASNFQSEQDELAFALKLSQEDQKHAPGITTSTPIASKDQYVVSSIALKLLLELTTCNRLQIIAENWRRSDCFTSLLLQLASHDLSIRAVFVNREVVCHLMDIVLGDQSPLLGTLYDRKGHKFAPSSFAIVYPIKPPTADTSSAVKTNEPTAANSTIIDEYQHLSSTSSTIPNWSSLLETVAHLVYTVRKDEYDRAILPHPTPQSTNTGGFLSAFTSHNTFSSQSSHTSYKPPLYLSEYDWKCLENRTFYSTFIRQCRYTPYMKKIIVCCSVNNVPFSDSLCDVFYETLSMGSIESVGHVFELIDLFLSIEDTKRIYRCSKLFSPTETSLISLFSSFKDQQIRAKYLNICLFSMFQIVRRNKCVSDLLAYPRNVANIWAPWMLKFCFQFQSKCQREHELATTLRQSSMEKNGNISTDNIDGNTGSIIPPVLVTGPYLVVFGESRNERELSWLARAERTFQLLHETLTRMDYQPDALMPEDAFVDIPDESPTTQLNSSSSGNMTADPFMTEADLFAVGLSDGMTDEELRKLFPLD